MRSLALACHCFEQGQRETAITTYEQALRLQPESIEALVNLASALCDLGELDQAMLHIKKALRIQPRCVEAIIVQANILRFQEDYKTALAKYDMALQFSPDLKAAILSNIGAVHREYGKPENALAYYEQALATEPKLLNASWNKATTLLRH